MRRLGLFLGVVAPTCITTLACAYAGDNNPVCFGPAAQWSSEFNAMNIDAKRAFLKRVPTVCEDLHHTVSLDISENVVKGRTVKKGVARANPIMQIHVKRKDGELFAFSERDFSLDSAQELATKADLPGNHAAILKAAKQGLPEAEFFVGLSYELGSGVQSDPASALPWYAASANKGFARAQYELGRYAQHGIGMRQDSATAMIWYVKASNLAVAQYAIGNLYLAGDGQKKDLAQALMWFQRAVTQGLPSAETALGRMYAFETSTGLDYNKAVQLFQQARAKGDSLAESSLGTMYLRGLGVPQDSFIAFSLYKAAAEKGDSLGEYNLGASYANGIGTVLDMSQALYWFQRSAGQENAFAELAIAQMYTHGSGVGKNESEARAWYRRAALHGNLEAQKELGRLCIGTVELEPDKYKPDYPEGCLRWYTLAADQGDRDAYAQIAWMYISGEGGAKKDADVALTWFQKAAADGDVDAMGAIGCMYYFGVGVALDRESAQKWFDRSHREWISHSFWGDENSCRYELKQYKKN